MIATRPAVAGIIRTPPSTLAICSSVIAASLAAKSTEPVTSRLMPSPLPTASYSTSNSGWAASNASIHFWYRGAGKVAPAPRISLAADWACARGRLVPSRPTLNGIAARRRARRCVLVMALASRVS